MEKSGEQFLHQKNPRFHISPQIEKTQKRRKARGEETTQKPADKIAAYLERLYNILNPEPLKYHPGFDRKKRNLSLLKKGLYESVIIKPKDIPETYFENQKQLAREIGYGDIEITEELRTQTIGVIIADQQSTLDNWVDYFTHSDSDSYPMWVKYWAFQDMLNLSNYDKEKHAFGNRKRDTVSPFLDLNREALAYVADAIIKRVENLPTDTYDPQFQKLLQGANFGKLYAWAIEKATPAQESELV